MTLPVLLNALRAPADACVRQVTRAAARGSLQAATLLLVSVAACTGGGASVRPTPPPAATAIPPTIAPPAPTLAPTSPPRPPPAPALATPTPAPTPAPPAIPAAVATPGPTSPLADEVMRIGALTAGVRGLPEVEGPDVRFVDADGMRAVIERQLGDPETVDDAASADAVLKMLGLLPPDLDFLEVERDLIGEAILGLYDPDTGALFVLAEGQGEAGLSPLSEVTLAHEYVHLLQDAHFGLDALTDATAEDGEHAMALSALAEGDAVLTQTLYAVDQLAPDELHDMLESDAEQEAALDAFPPFLLRTLKFPYTAGVEFVAALWRNGGFERVDQAWADPPATTEQVLHPEKYASREPAALVALPDLGPVLGEDWEVRDRDVLGEFFIEAWLETLGGNATLASAAAEGWGGDGYVLLERPDGDRAFAALIDWDVPAVDAPEFMEGLADALNAAPEFERVPTEGAGMTLWDGPDGVLAVASDEASGRVAISVAPAAADAGAMVRSLLSPGPGAP